VEKLVEAKTRRRLPESNDRAVGSAVGKIEALKS